MKKEESEKWVSLRVQAIELDCLALTPDRTALIVGGQGVGRWSLQTGDRAPGSGYYDPSQRAYSIVFNPNGDSAIIGGGIVWVSNGLCRGGKAAVFSPDGNTIAIGEITSLPDGNKIRIYDLGSGNELKTFRLDYSSHNNVLLDFSPNGKHILSGQSEGGLTLWDVSSGKELRIFDGNRDWYEIDSVAFSRDGKIAAALLDGGIELFDIASGKNTGTLKASLREELIEQFPKIAKEIYKTVVTEDLVITLTRENGVKLTDRRSGKHLANIFWLVENEWLVTTPEGFFDGSWFVWDKVSWRFDNWRIKYGIVELYDYFYPNLLKDVLNGNAPVVSSGDEYRRETLMRKLRLLMRKKEGKEKILELLREYSQE